jgi:aspartate dehydrogenase
MKRTLRLAFIGWGAINTRVNALLTQRQAHVEIVGIATSGAPESRGKLPATVTFLGDSNDLARAKADLVVEAAGRVAIEQWAPSALEHTSSLIVASTSAFCDDTLLPRLVAIAERHGSRIIIPSGAIGGIDALASAAVLGLDSVLHQVLKPPVAWKGTEAEGLLDLANLDRRMTFFFGTAREAASRYPQNANATIITSLAGIGLDKTMVELVADPSLSTNGHRIVAHGQFGSMDIHLRNNPLATNPKSSELTALNLVHLIENLANPISI